ncbi:hypothetical protein NDU88_004791 [Pleurodeles waltl]|uniref:Uncharacterized protein n=1 Tax=Pleurodeles waltl TaxID=8319 RepID=A0AAV7KZD8_PLEWA|nr:hypothetical protein NDU88_004791 [Pleurodeles waltl]
MHRLACSLSLQGQLLLRYSNYSSYSALESGSDQRRSHGPAPRALHWGTAFATATRPRKRFRPKRQQEDRLPATQSGLGCQRAHGSHYIAIPSPRGTACINATRPRAQGALAQRQDHTPNVPAITIATPGAGKADTPPACRQALTTTPGAGKLGKFTLQGLQGTAHKRDATLQHEHSPSQYQGNAKKK